MCVCACVHVCVRVFVCVCVSVCTSVAPPLPLQPGSKPPEGKEVRDICSFSIYPIFYILYYYPITIIYIYIILYLAVVYGYIN